MAVTAVTAIRCLIPDKNRLCKNIKNIGSCIAKN